MKIKIEKIIKDALESVGVQVSEAIEVTHPDILSMGDYTCSIAMSLAKKDGKNPRELAELIVSSIKKNENIEKVEVAGPGYINFYLSKSFYKRYLEENIGKVEGKVSQKGDFIQDEFRKVFPKDTVNSLNILLEHSSPNLFKPFHVGHMVNNSIGESLGRIMSQLGNHLKILSFPSDISPGIAKTVWSIKEQKLDIDKITLYDIADAYVSGTKEYKENEVAKSEINQINIDLYNKKEGVDLEIYDKGKSLSLEHFEYITSKLGSNFEDIIYESESEVVGKKVVLKNLAEGKVFEKSDNSEAIIFKGSNYGLFDNVFINSDGFGTYLAKDIGLLKIKSEKDYFHGESIGSSLVITDVEQLQHFQLVKKSSSLLDETKELSGKSTYLQHGRMSFVGKEKVSSRYGNVPLIIDVIEKVQKKVLSKMVDRGFSRTDEKEISEKIAIGILKYAILRIKAGKNIAFDIDKDTNPIGNSASFLLYTFVRASSIYNKRSSFSKMSSVNLEEKKGDTSDLEKILYRFDEVVEKSYLDYSPHHVASYCYDLAKRFNSFYENTKILDEDSVDFDYNFAVLELFGKTMHKGLDLLGIETVEKM